MTTSADWFTNVFGFKEKTGPDYMETHRLFKLEGEGKKRILISNGNKRRFQVGEFKCLHVADLRHFFAKEDHAKQLKGRLKVTEIVQDVSELHTKPENRCAVFQVASQFNCLEFPDPSQKPEDGITVYEYDRTQGPACAIACAPGTVYRNYFAMEGNKPQTKDNQVNNLQQILHVVKNEKNKFFTCNSGYTDASNDDLKNFEKIVLANPQTRDEHKEVIRKSLLIGQQIDTQVTGSNFGGRTLSKEDSDKQIVTQVFCSACSVSYSRASEEKWAEFGTVILEAAYEAVMYVAIKNAFKHKCEHGSKKVFLTALGGGAFGNRSQWIIKAMERAFEIFKDIGLEVIIVSYGSPWHDAKGLLEKYPYPSSTDK